VGIGCRPGFCDGAGHLQRDLAVLGLGRAHGWCARTIETGVESSERIAKAGGSLEVRKHDLIDVARHAAWPAHQCDDVADIRRLQAGLQHALPDQPGGAHQQHPHCIAIAHRAFLQCSRA